MNQHCFTFDQLPQLAAPNNLFDVRYIHSENITVAFNKLKEGASVPAHQHLHETIDIVLDGELALVVDDQTTVMTAGMVARVPSNIRHSAIALSDCTVINIFYPVRDDFEDARA